jgi:hypothetical protein
MRRWLFTAGVLGILIVLGFLLTTWRAENQIQKRMHALLTSASNRNWKTAGTFFSDSYRDAWGQTREQALTSASEVGRHFLVLEIIGTGRVEVDGKNAVWRGKLAFSGRGTALGEMIFSRTSELKNDFVFAWQKENWKPWSWKLVSIAQPEIVFDPQWLQ